jgi:hypothetical protein
VFAAVGAGLVALATGSTRQLPDDVLAALLGNDVVDAARALRGQLAGTYPEALIQAIKDTCSSLCLFTVCCLAERRDREQFAERREQVLDWIAHLRMLVTARGGGGTPAPRAAVRGEKKSKNQTGFFLVELRNSETGAVRAAVGGGALGATAMTCSAPTADLAARVVDDEHRHLATAEREQPREQGFPCVVVVLRHATAERREVVENEHTAAFQQRGDRLLARRAADVQRLILCLKKLFVMKPHEVLRSDGDGEGALL